MMCSERAECESCHQMVLQNAAWKPDVSEQVRNYRLCKNPAKVDRKGKGSRKGPYMAKIREQQTRGNHKT